MAMGENSRSVAANATTDGSFGKQCYRGKGFTSHSHKRPADANCRPVPEGFTVAKEGQARILQQSNEAFYNPAQVGTP